MNEIIIATGVCFVLYILSIPFRIIAVANRQKEERDETERLNRFRLQSDEFQRNFMFQFEPTNRPIQNEKSSDIMFYRGEMVKKNKSRVCSYCGEPKDKPGKCSHCGGPDNN